MINLIPPEEKKRLIRNFYYRVAVVFVVATSFAVLVSTVAITPAYFLSVVKKNLAESRLKNQLAEPVPIPDQQTLALVEDLNSKLGVIEKAQSQKFSVSERVITEIILKKLVDIKIHQISYESDETEGKKIMIRGIAPSRERLLLFRRALEDDSYFKQVDLPISNFIKGSNIQFSLSLIPA